MVFGFLVCCFVVCCFLGFEVAKFQTFKYVQYFGKIMVPYYQNGHFMSSGRYGSPLLRTSKLSFHFRKIEKVFVFMIFGISGNVKGTLNSLCLMAFLGKSVTPVFDLHIPPVVSYTPQPSWVPWVKIMFFVELASMPQF